MADWDDNKDPWKDPFSNGLSNGDGFFFYPPKDNTIAFNPCDPSSNRLVPSIRLELLREGLEDFAYFWLLNSGGPQIGAENQVDELLQAMIYSRTAFNRNPNAMQALRAEMAELILAKQTRIYLPLVLH